MLQNRTFLISWRGFLQGFVVPWLALHHMKPQWERSDGIGPGRLGGISSFRAHGKEGLHPVSDELDAEMIQHNKISSQSCYTFSKNLEKNQTPVTVTTLILVTKN